MMPWPHGVQCSAVVREGTHTAAMGEAPMWGGCRDRGMTARSHATMGVGYRYTVQQVGEPSMQYTAQSPVTLAGSACGARSPC